MANAKLITIPEAALLLNLSIAQIYYLIRKGTLKPTQRKERMLRLSDVNVAKRNRPKRGNPNFKRKDT